MSTPITSPNIHGYQLPRRTLLQMQAQLVSSLPLALVQLLVRLAGMLPPP